VSIGTPPGVVVRVDAQPVASAAHSSAIEQRIMVLMLNGGGGVPRAAPKR
jgi:hypothetical protein